MYQNVPYEKKYSKEQYLKMQKTHKSHFNGRLYERFHTNLVRSTLWDSSVLIWTRIKKVWNLLSSNYGPDINGQISNPMTKKKKAVRCFRLFRPITGSSSRISSWKKKEEKRATVVQGESRRLKISTDNVITKKLAKSLPRYFQRGWKRERERERATLPEDKETVVCVCSVLL